MSADGWIKRVRELNTVLEQCQTTAEGIIGLPPDDQNKFRDQTDCLARALDMELDVAFDRMYVLHRALRDIVRKFCEGLEPEIPANYESQNDDA